MAEQTVDVVVVGAGPAGEVAAGRCAEGGLEVALVERELVGGECSYWACMPSKALLRPGQALAEARRVPGAREAAEGELDVGAALARRDEVIHHLDDSSQQGWIDDRGITLVRADGRLEGERRVRAGDDVVVARRAVVLATGSSALLPPIDGLREAKPWTNREATTAGQVPARLVVLGGGPAGVELAQAYASFGARVVLVEDAERLIPHEEPFAAEHVGTALREAGVDVRLGQRAVRVHRNGLVTVELESGERVEGDELLVAVGRRPRTEDLGLEAVGGEPGKPVEVDDLLRVGGREWLYAIGDVNGRVLLTHMGKHQGRVVADAILGRDGGTARDAIVGGPPRVIFTEPQVAAVGHTEQTARDAGLRIRVVEFPVQKVAGGSFVGKGVPGLARLVVDEDRRVVVGATFTGADVAEMLHAATIAVIGEVPLERLWHAVPSFPTRSEVWLRLLEAYGV